MKSLLTVNFSNTSSSVLQAHFLPEIILDEDYDYSCALLDLIIKTKEATDLNVIAELDIFITH